MLEKRKADRKNRQLRTVRDDKGKIVWVSLPDYYAMRGFL